MATPHGAWCNICHPITEAAFRAKKWAMDPDEEKEFKDAKRIAILHHKEVSHVQVLFACDQAQREANALPSVLAS